MPIPTVLWAQRKDKLYITIDVQDVKDQQVSLAEGPEGLGKLTFKGMAGPEPQSEFELDLDLMEKIDVKESKVSVSGRNIFLVVMKVDPGHWPRLTKDSGRHLSHIKCDWNKWVDEDDEEEGLGQLDTSQYKFDGFDQGGMGGPGGMGGMMGGMGGMGDMMSGMGGMGGMGGMDMAAMMAKMGSGMGGMGMGGGGEGDEDESGDDSDDDDLPDLEPAQ